MKVFVALLLLGLLTVPATSEEEKANTDDPCARLEIEDCVHTEFEAYMKCIEESKAKRIKRQAQCPYTINSQQPVYYPAQQQLYQQQVVPNAPVNNDADLITENHVEYIPQVPGHRQVIITTNNNSTPTTLKREIVPGHNITTVINLNNIINNTNIIDSPTNINNTNINNIHIYQNKTSTTGGKFGLGYTEKGPCCFAVRPKTCRKTTTGPKCHHHRHRTCGPNCTSRIIHAQVRRRCTSHSGCHRRTVHIPQPPPPRCYATYYWPYTICGGNQPSSCDGCYDHYGYGYENYYGGGYDDSRCYGCYDDGYDQGPLYRRGPVLRPTHYHETPCEISGTCDDGYYRNQNGYFGHDRINPAFHEEDFAYYDGDEIDFARVFNISTLNESGEADDEEAEQSGDFAIQSRKCRTVEESNGSVIIRNCTLEDLNNHYAGSHSETYQEPDRKNVRRSSAQYYNYPPPPPIPMYYPPPPPYMTPYMMPPPRGGQYRHPYHYENEDDYDSNEDDNDFDNEVDYRPKTKSLAKKRKHSKKRVNRFPIDEEDLDAFKDDQREFDVYSAETH